MYVCVCVHISSTKAAGICQCVCFIWSTAWLVFDSVIVLVCIYHLPQLLASAIVFVCVHISSTTTTTSATDAVVCVYLILCYVIILCTTAPGYLSFILIIKGEKWWVHSSTSSSSSGIRVMSFILTIGKKVGA